jgi:hypothetical protein
MRILNRLAAVAYYGKNPRTWNSIPPTIDEEQLGLTSQGLRQAWRGIYVPAKGEDPMYPDSEDDASESEPILAFPIVEIRGSGRRREFRLMEENFDRAPIRAPRKLKRKPPKSEGIEDLDPEKAEQDNPPPLAALRQVAPNVTNVTLASGRVISLAAAVEHARTCPLLEKSFVEMKEVTKPKGNSSFLFLEELNAAISPRFPGKSVSPDTWLWRNILIVLRGVPRQAFLAVVRAKVEEARSAPSKFQKIGLLLELAKEAAAEWRPFAPVYPEFHKHFSVNRHIRWACDEVGIDEKRGEEWASWIEEDPDGKGE